MKAEVIDFETVASVRARSRRAKGARASTQEKNQPNTSAQTNNHDLKLTIPAAAPQQLAEADEEKQRSILSYWGAQLGETTLGTAKTSGSIINGSIGAGDVVSNVTGSLQDNDDVIGTVGTEDAASLLGSDKPRADKDATVPRIGTDKECVPEPSLLSTERSSSSRGLTGGRGSGRLARSNNDSGVRATAAGGGQRGRGGRHGDRGRGRGRVAHNSAAAAAAGGTGCGQAVVEWAWEYFCTPWNTEKVYPAANKPKRSPAGPSIEGARTFECSGTDERPQSVGIRGEPLFVRDDAGEMGTDCSESSSSICDTTHSGGDGGRAYGRGKREQRPWGEESPPSPACRLPPPLYLQHDGHSRTVVGVLWPEGRNRVGRGGGAGVGREDRSVAGHEGAGRGRPGNLLVFDPSHAGPEIRDALANEDNLRWCRCVGKSTKNPV